MLMAKPGVPIYSQAFANQTSWTMHIRHFLPGISNWNAIQECCFQRLLGFTAETQSAQMDQGTSPATDLYQP